MSRFGTLLFEALEVIANYDTYQSVHKDDALHIAVRQFRHEFQTSREEEDLQLAIHMSLTNESAEIHARYYDSDSDIGIVRWVPVEVISFGSRDGLAGLSDDKISDKALLNKPLLKESAERIEIETDLNSPMKVGCKTFDEEEPQIPVKNALAMDGSRKPNMWREFPETIMGNSQVHTRTAEAASFEPPTVVEDIIKPELHSATPRRESMQELFPASDVAYAIEIPLNAAMEGVISSLSLNESQLYKLFTMQNSPDRNQKANVKSLKTSIRELDQTIKITLSPIATPFPQPVPGSVESEGQTGTNTLNLQNVNLTKEDYSSPKSYSKTQSAQTNAYVSSMTEEVRRSELYHSLVRAQRRYAEKISIPSSSGRFTKEEWNTLGENFKIGDWEGGFLVDENPGNMARIVKKENMPNWKGKGKALEIESDDNRGFLSV